MHAMQTSPAIEYTLWRVALSVGVAIAASIAALWLAFTLRTTGMQNRVAKRLGAAFIMAIAITGMHYFGMFLAFLRCSADRIVGAGNACAAPAG